MVIDINLVEMLLADHKKPEDIFGENGLPKQHAGACQQP